MHCALSPSVGWALTHPCATFALFWAVGLKYCKGKRVKSCPSLCHSSGSVRGRITTNHSRLCMITFSLCKIVRPLLAEAALQARFRIRRSSALSGVMVGLISINDGKLDCFKHSRMWYQEIFNRRWRTQYDSFNISLCAGLLPGEDSHTCLEKGAPSSKDYGQPSIPTLCDVLLVFSRFRVIEVSVTPTLLCPEGVDMDCRDNFFFPPCFWLCAFLLRGILSSSAVRKSCNKFLAGETFIQSKWKYSQTMTLQDLSHGVKAARFSCMLLLTFCVLHSAMPEQSSCTDPAGMQIGPVSTRHLQGSGIVVISSSSIIFTAEPLLMCLLFISSSI